jgi:hypothetical protein
MVKRLMEPKIYLIVYDMIKNDNALSALHRYIMDSKDFVGYWNYLPFVYIVKSYETIAILREKFSYIFPKGGFLIVQIQPHAGIDGLLPREAWDWFSHSHGQLSLADILQQQLGEKKPAGIGSGLGLRGLGGLLGDQTKK